MIMYVEDAEDQTDAKDQVCSHSLDLFYEVS
jgi:hypothetical protein